MMMQKEKDFGMRLMRRDFWSGLWKRHKNYRHPARVGCDTYERAFKKYVKTEKYLKNRRLNRVIMRNDIKGNVGKK